MRISQFTIDVLTHKSYCGRYPISHLWQEIVWMLVQLY